MVSHDLPLNRQKSGTLAFSKKSRTAKRKTKKDIMDLFRIERSVWVSMIGYTARINVKTCESNGRSANLMKMDPVGP